MGADAMVASFYQSRRLALFWGGGGDASVWEEDEETQSYWHDTAQEKKSEGSRRRGEGLCGKPRAGEKREQTGAGVLYT
jgi:hypothetical protein